MRAGSGREDKDRYARDEPGVVLFLTNNNLVLHGAKKAHGFYLKEIVSIYVDGVVELKVAWSVVGWDM